MVEEATPTATSDLLKHRNDREVALRGARVTKPHSAESPIPAAPCLASGTRGEMADGRVVTGISASGKHPGRFDVEVDQALCVTLTLDIVERLGLKAGMPVSDALAASLYRERQLLVTYDRAMAMLAARSRSARELRRRLVQKGEPSEAADAAIERLVACGFLNDAMYARQFARSRMAGAGLARRRLRQELARRGVADELAERAIEDMVKDDAIDEGAILERVARKKLRTLSALDEATKRRRLFGYLARRGYEVADIQRLMREMSLDAFRGDRTEPI